MTNSDGNLDYDGAEYPPVWAPTAAQQARMDTALALQAMPGTAIREMGMTPPPMPPRYGRGPGMPDILTCWEASQAPPVHSIMDYTDDEAGLQSTARPSLGQW